MVLAGGMRVGHYQIVEPLGAGGMGEVYRALDPRLGREVAIKILREDAVDAGDRRRFEIEARASSSLEHPNILTIHDIGEEDGRPYIVSELLEGHNLRSLLPAGGMPVRKLLDIAVQIAAGLAAAHASGIVHRDLKPENIMVLRDGRVKILDFGLAKAACPQASVEDTRTASGIVVGTLGYMSPEQAQGEPVDYRSDQFSLGSMLYEMVTGRRPFQRKDRVSTLAAIANEEPSSIASLNPMTPPPLRWIVDRCLAKDPVQRYDSTADLCQQLKDVRDHLSEIFSTDAGFTARPRPVLRSRWPYGVAALGLLAIAAGLFFARSTTSTPYQFIPFATDAVDEMQPAWSPDGRTIAYTAAVNGVMQVFARNLDSPVPARITSAESSCAYPFWSPDGSRIYYTSGTRLWSVGATGGAPEEVIGGVVAGTPPASAAADGKTIAYFRNEGAAIAIGLLSLRDGKQTTYKHAPFPSSFRLTGGLAFSPDGKVLLAWIVPDVEAGAELWLLPYPEGEPRRLSKPVHRLRALTASWMPDNRHIVIAMESMAGAGSHLSMLDIRSGDLTGITVGTSEEREPSSAPDGKRLVFVSGGMDTDLVDVTLDGSQVIPLLSTSRREHSADWSPDGRQYVYVSDAAGPPEIWLRSLSERWPRPVVRSLPDDSLAYAIPRFSPDGQRLAYVRVGAKHLIWLSNLSSGQAVPLEQESPDQHSPAWSPDGNSIAYVRYMGNKWEIEKAPSGGSGRPVHVCDGGTAGSVLQWSPAGGWIGYTYLDSLYLVPAAGGTPAPIARGVSAFAFTHDGSGLYAVRRAKDRRWELALVTVPDGVERKVTPLYLPTEIGLQGARLNPDGGRITLTQSSSRRDIWILEGLHY